MCSSVEKKENQIKKLTDAKREIQEKYTREVRKRDEEIHKKNEEISKKDQEIKKNRNRDDELQKKIQGIQHLNRSYNCINTWHFMYNIQCTGTEE